MRIKLQYCLTTVLFSFLLLPSLCAQEEILDEFRMFTNRQQQEYNRTIQQMNKEFALYIKRPWKSFDIYITSSPLQDPNIPSNTPFLQKTETKLDTIIPQQTESITLKLNYYGRQILIPYSASYHINVRGVTENDISHAWNQAADVNLEPLLKTLLNYRKQLQLNDWAFYLLIRQVAESIFNERSSTSTVFFSAYCLNQLGYSGRMGRAGLQLLLMAEIKETVYVLPQLTIGDRCYTILNGENLQATDRVSTYTKSFPKATQALSMQITQHPLFGNAIENSYLTNTWHNEKINITYNRHLLDFYNTMPQTDFTVYGNTVLSPEMESFIQWLKEKIYDKGEIEAASLLLDFVQNAFGYQTDGEQFGKEKVFFPDENLYYPNNDCEDRAILYCHLVRKLLGLKVALVNYPNHIASAVCFSEKPSSGTHYRRGNDSYTLCDPTYLGAGIGDCMPQFKNKNPKLILLSNL